MHINNISGTCSMLELLDVEEEDLHFKNKNDFYLMFYSEDTNKINDKSYKSIIYNCTLPLKYRKKLLELGFKEVFKYKGNETNCRGNSKMVYTYMTTTKEFLKGIEWKKKESY